MPVIDFAFDADEVVGEFLDVLEAWGELDCG
jgi:hypothetical protein